LRITVNPLSSLYCLTWKEDCENEKFTRRMRPDKKNNIRNAFINSDFKNRKREMMN